MLKCPADVYGHDFSPVALLEKRIHHLEQQSLHPCSGLRDLCIHLHLAVQVDSVIDKVNSGQGTIGQLLVNQQLYDNLNGATRQMNLLMQDFRANPKKFLRIKLSLF